MSSFTPAEVLDNMRDELQHLLEGYTVLDDVLSHFGLPPAEIERGKESMRRYLELVKATEEHVAAQGVKQGAAEDGTQKASTKVRRLAETHNVTKPLCVCVL
jgi:hypothetical protein